jgi:hypothetical protein
VNTTKEVIEKEIDNQIKDIETNFNERIDKFAKCLCDIVQKHDAECGKEYKHPNCLEEYKRRIVAYMQKMMVEKQKSKTAYMLSKVNDREEHLRKAAMKLAKYQVGVRHIKKGDLDIIDDLETIERDYHAATAEDPKNVGDSNEELEWKMSKAAAQGYMNAQLSHAACVVIETALLDEETFEDKKDKKEIDKNAESLVAIVNKDKVWLGYRENKDKNKDEAQDKTKYKTQDKNKDKTQDKNKDKPCVQYQCEVKGKTYDCVPIVNHDPDLHEKLQNKGCEDIDSFYYIVLIDRNTEVTRLPETKQTDDANYVPLIFHKSSAVPVSNYEREKQWKTIRDLHFGLCKNSGDRTPAALDKAIRLLLGRKI